MFRVCENPGRDHRGLILVYRLGCPAPCTPVGLPPHLPWTCILWMAGSGLGACLGLTKGSWPGKPASPRPLSQSNVAASNAKLALFYDWLFFSPDKDSIMNIGAWLPPASAARPARCRPRRGLSRRAAWSGRGRSSSAVPQGAPRAEQGGRWGGHATLAPCPCCLGLDQGRCLQWERRPHPASLPRARDEGGRGLPAFLGVASFGVCPVGMGGCGAGRRL